jgi:murein DD-endopeptidase MepM/ murein hydrolase activator NlpD
MKFNTQINTKSKFFFMTLYKIMLISIIASFSPILYPKTVNAGLFSFFSDLAGDNVSAETLSIPNATNSQNMLVLQAAVNSDPNPNKTENDTPIISGSALVATIGPSGTISEVDQQETATQISLYTVREGDTLSKIAKMFGVTTNTIIWANDLGRNPTLVKDQKLIILPISGIKYTVKKGDTLGGIVTRYKSDLNEVLQFNDLTLYSMLNIGDIIVIPDAEPTATPVYAVRKTTKVGVNPVHDANGPYYPGYYDRPIDGGRESQGLHGYNAVDLAAPIGTPIHASAAGIIIASMNSGSWNGGYGNYVIISHPNGTQTLYSHNQKNFVSVGDRVVQGQMIAKIGMTGKTTGPHVHFEIRGAKNPF